MILLGTIAWLATTFRGRIILGILLGIVGLVAVVCSPHNLRIRRVRKAFKNLPKEVKEQVLDLIEEAATKHPSNRRLSGFRRRANREELRRTLSIVV